MENIPYWKKSICFAEKSDVGMRRANNQDSYGIRIAGTARQWLLRGHLFVVADGMGAHAAGEVASKMAVDTVMQSYLKRTHESPTNALARAVMDAHNRIRERSKREDAFHDMGTTCDAFTLTPQGLIIAHVGDSRVYRIRSNCIEQMTFDHSLVWEICEAHNLPYDNPPYHIPKNQITRSLGPTEKLTVDVEGPHRILVGDIFLACSDGLTGQVKDYEIGEIVTVFPPDIAVETLINIANLRGGPDNTTIVIVKTTKDEKTEQEINESMKLPTKSKILISVTIILATLVLITSLLGNFIFSIISGSVAAVTATWFFLSSQSYLFGNSLFINTTTHGKAPYTNAPCQPEENFTESLAKILAEVKAAIQNKEIKINTKEANNCEQKANTAQNNKNYTTAIQNYAMAINLLMRELKK
ncbi:MAG: protein phosphatase 2C domain-containing protein [Planctomycetaceae bacterium]|jgi:protein phosphatase|nr:protein phosphatase 2C domain-containing protein [Planctomycetaceae bacterium]